MLTEERHASILDLLKQKGIVKTKELMETLQCSESTIRRDLDELEKNGLLRRVHGGAKRIYRLDDELSIQEKSLKNVHEKDAIGQTAASFIENNDVIYVDAGTSTLSMIDFIESDDITVVTNGIQHASLLADKNIHTILVGGRIKPSTKAIIGPTSQKEISDYRFNKAFLGINGIDMEYGCTTPDPDEAALKKLVIKNSSKAYMLADHSKWGKINFVKVCDLEEVTIITSQSKINLQEYKQKTNVLEVER
ncbi:DeoR/GlpR family DNA-binding transcription regulator [Oceanobacillus luteolus]|uniref:DeoR/GlpR family DNA-binding transcription regulator n=1 Tax=Oceanobacillus luteolus TaxID=1274358 RepID=UPI00203DF88A|nr:DeoR/GlpR family DNA-binding transcription regulator [Oceanobacillus luteolus]MCM3739796.1 DeoR/GlpR family DNA-binding transcription regulator [Oceanobacillus luteolus]